MSVTFDGNDLPHVSYVQIRRRALSETVARANVDVVPAGADVEIVNVFSDKYWGRLQLREGQTGRLEIVGEADRDGSTAVGTWGEVFFVRCSTPMLGKFAYVFRALS